MEPIDPKNLVPKKEITPAKDIQADPDARALLDMLTD